MTGVKKVAIEAFAMGAAPAPEPAIRGERTAPVPGQFPSKSKKGLTALA
jgi:hypothetical protein